MKTVEAPLAGQAELPTSVEAFQAFLREQARRALMAMIAQEVDELCGPRYRPDAEANHYRSGSVDSPVELSGHREVVRRPRVRQRSESGSVEVLLKTWEMAREPSQWENAMMRAILCGVSTRQVAALREESLRGESKSSLSRLWAEKAQALVEEIQQAPLESYDLLVLMVDAVVLCRGLVATVALGIDTTGTKRVLGFRVGASENEEVCSDLLKHLYDRNLRVPSGRRLLAVLDGSKALRKAVMRHWPNALIQRCLVHKERNLRGYLARKHWKPLAELFDRLRKCQGSHAAREVAGEIEAFLRDKNAQARASFEEAGEELLAFFTLEVPNTLHVSLLSTNAIENTFKNLRRHIDRVCRWREGSTQADRWIASGLILAQKGFNRIQGTADLPLLVAALSGAGNRAAPTTGTRP